PRPTLFPYTTLFRSDAAFGNSRMREQHFFHFRPGDVVAGRDDHVVGARLIMEIAVLVLQVGIAGKVPAVLHILGLAVVGEVAARSEEHTSELQSREN